MARVTGPLMSMEASGTLAGTLTFAKWKGRPYTRSRVIPHNPKSDAQVSTRAMMRFLSQIWASIGDGEKAAWKPTADQLSISPFNAFVRFNMAAWTQLLYPVESPSFETDFTGEAITGLTGAGGVSEISGAIAVADGGNNWGYVIYASTSAITPARSQAKLVLPDNGTNSTPFTIGNLMPGSYHVKAYAFHGLQASNSNHAITGDPIAVT